MTTSTREKAEELLQQILLDGTAEDGEVLMHLLQGLRDKQTGFHRRYINAALHMTGEFCPDHSIIRIPITPVIHNTIKLPHGGILATIADAAMGELAARAVEQGKNVVTTNLHINYLATTTNKELIAKGYFVNKGRRMLVMESIIEDETGKKLATATATFFVIEARK